MSVCPNICIISFSNMDILFHVTDAMISPNFLLRLQHYNYLVLTPLTTLQHHQKIYVFFLPLFFIQMFQGQSRDRPMLVNQLWRICVRLVAISQSNQFKSSLLFYQQDSLHSRVHKIQWKFKHKVLDVEEIQYSKKSGKTDWNWLQIYIRNICVKIKSLGQARQEFYMQFHMHKLRQLLAKTTSKFGQG